MAERVAPGLAHCPQQMSASTNLELCDVYEHWDDESLEPSLFEAPAVDTTYFDMMIDSILGDVDTCDNKAAATSDDAVPTPSQHEPTVIETFQAIESHDPWKADASRSFYASFTPPPSGTHDSNELFNDEPHLVTGEGDFASPPDSTPGREDSTEVCRSLEPDSTEQKSVEEYEICQLISHRIDTSTSTIEFKVEWAGGETTWEAERDLQLQVPRFVLDYWDACGGRQQSTGLDQFHVLQIIGTRGAKPYYHVQWVGYRRSIADTSWETRERMAAIAPRALIAFETKIASTKKQPLRAGPGRPRKKSNASNRARRNSKTAKY